MQGSQVGRDGEDRIGGEPESAFIPDPLSGSASSSVKRTPPDLAKGGERRRWRAGRHWNLAARPQRISGLEGTAGGRLREGGTDPQRDFAVYPATDAHSLKLGGGGVGVAYYCEGFVREYRQCSWTYTVSVTTVPVVQDQPNVRPARADRAAAIVMDASVSA